MLFRSAIQDGSIATPDNAADKELEAADTVAGEKAEEYDIRPEEPKEQTGRKGKDKS